MEKQARRQRFDYYLAYALISLTVITFALLARNAWIVAGAALTVAGFGSIAWHVRRSRTFVRSHAEDGSEPSIDFQRALLEQQLALAEKHLWLRVAAVTPGPLLFSIGFAIAYPHAAPIIYVQMATFILVVIAIVPLNRRKAARVRAQLDALTRDAR